MQVKLWRLLAVVRRIKAVDATTRLLPKRGKRRDRAAWQAPANNDLQQDDHPIFQLDLVPVSPVSLNAPASDSVTVLCSSAIYTVGHGDTPPVATGLYSDSDSDSVDELSVRSTGSTLFDEASYITAEELLFKLPEMDPLSGQTAAAAVPYSRSPALSTPPPGETSSRSNSASGTGGDASPAHDIGTGAVRERGMLSAGYESREDILLARSPPPVLVEPEVPDPFIVDDGEESSEEDQSSGEGVPESTTPSVEAEAEDEIALAQSMVLEPDPSTPTQPPPLPALSIAPITSPQPRTSPFSLNSNVFKDVPAPPSPASSDEDSPDLYLPGLVIPTMFLPIPNTDPLTTLLTKYIPVDKRPPRDLSGEWQQNDFHTLVMTNSWRAVARMARDQIVSSNPSDLSLVLSYWFVRLAALSRLRLFNQTSAECTNLFNVLNAVEPPSARAWLFEKILPFELEVLQAKTQYWAGDHMGYLDALAALLTRCKVQSRAAQRRRDKAGSEMWKERGSRVCLILASQLIEMKDYIAAARLLEPLCQQDVGTTCPHLRSAIARIYLQGGYMSMAIKHLKAVAQDETADLALRSMNEALLASAEGDWERAADMLRQIVENDPENFAAVNNLAVALLSQGHLQEGIQVLEDALRMAPSTIVTAEPFLFNLSTLYELRSSTAADKKRELLVEVAKWAGDGLRTACLKMPTT